MTPPAANDDLSALAWVQAELRRSLEAAHKALRRHLKEAEAAVGADLDEADPAVLRSARGHLHQGVGALELVGLPEAAQVLRASERALQRWATKPEQVTPAAVEAIERASFALLDFLQRRLAGRAVSPVAMFPQYQAVMQLAAAERVHPADLWPHPWQWRELPPDGSATPRAADDAARGAMESLVLSLLRQPDRLALARMGDLCADLAAGARLAVGGAPPAGLRQTHAATFWQLAAAVFEALAVELLPNDVHAKRLASRLLAQLRGAARGEPPTPAQATTAERLAHDLLFFCAHARTPGPSQPAPRLAQVRQSWGLGDAADAAAAADTAADYETARLGRFDPALLAQARKRLAAAKDAWSAAAAGETQRLGSLAEAFALVGDSAQKLLPEGAVLAQALRDTAHQVLRASAAPAPALAMETATSLLYLEACLDEGELDHPEMAARMRHLAERIVQVAAGAETQPLQPWMEEMYRRVSDRQTLGSVVQELRGALSEVEKQVDAFFRAPAQRELLAPVPGQLAAMRGVLSVLGLDAAGQAVLQMRETVEALASTPASSAVDSDAPRTAGIFERLADNLGALSFLVDLLGVQPQLAKRLFSFDPASGRLNAVMAPSERPSAFGSLDSGSGFGALPLQSVADVAADVAAGGAADTAADVAPDASPDVAPAVAHTALAHAPAPALHAPPEAATAPPPTAFEPVSSEPTTTGLEDDPEMREIFIEEAREVVAAAGAALQRLAEAPDDLHDLTVLRRAFHTLKGSARMVGLRDFAEAAWTGEQLFNARLAQSAPRLDLPLRQFSTEALAYLGDWAEAIAAGQTRGHSSAPVAHAAQALRAPAAAEPVPAPVPAAEPAAEPTAEPTAEALAEPVIEAFAEALTEPLAEDLAAPLAEPITGDLAEPTATPVVELSSEPAALPATDAGDAPALPLPVLDFAFDLADEAAIAAASATPLTAAAEQDEGPALADELARMLAGLPDAPADATADAATAWPAPEVVETPLDEVAAYAADPLAAPEPEPEPEPLALTARIPDLPSAADLDLGGIGLDLPPPTDAAPLLVDGQPDAVAPAPIDLDLPPLAAWEGEPLSELPAPPEPPEPVERIEAPEPVLELADVEEIEEPVKVIGTLRIGIPLFNIFLNEADEQSRRLCTALAEWAAEGGLRPAPEEGAALAHALAGNSATVGYTELSALARALEHALLRAQDGSEGAAAAPADEAALFNEVADEIRRLLHQFAAGFLRPAPEVLLQRLAAHEPAAAPQADTGPAPLAPATNFGTLAPMAALPALADDALLATGARPDAFDDDEDIDAEDAVDAELFPIFSEEAEELLPRLQAGLRDWLAAPSDGAAAAGCMRTLHTLKGGARLAGAMRLGEVAHRLETAIEHRLAEPGRGADAVEPLLARADRMSAAFEALRQPAAATAAQAPAPAYAPAPALALPPAPAPAMQQPAAEVAAGAPEADAALAVPSAPPPSPPVATPPPPAWVAVTTAAAGTVASAASASERGSSAVRVRAGMLDRLVNNVGEVSIARARIDGEMRTLQGSLAELTESLDRLRKQLRDIELQAETQMSSRLEAAKASSQAFDPLEMDRFTRFQELTRFMAESVNDVATLQRGLQRTLQSTEDELAAQARLTRSLQEDLLRTRMVQFESLAERLYRVVRQAAKDTGKQVRLDIVGGAIEVDRSVLERMVGPFEHLLRNAVAHGVETPEQRAAAGKDASGRVVVQVAQSGNEVAVEFADDGAGLDLPRIRERAVARGLLAPDAAPSEAELAQLIFAPGFSTAETVTELAGRGVGMDVVRDEVLALGGRIEIASSPGQGTRLTLLLPLTTAVTQVVLLRSGSLSVAVPANLVEVVKRVGAEEIEHGYTQGAIEYSGEAVPFYWLAALLHAGTRGRAGGRNEAVVIVRSAQQRVALHVDDVAQNQEVVVKNVGPQLARVPALVGVTLLPSGAVALIYNPVALAALHGETARVLMRHSEGDGSAGAGETAPAVPARTPLVLVVDDSLTVRRVTQRLLLREGYRVATAKDGLEALERLALERPAVLLSDIEMPRMDGFDLLRNVRADALLAGLPVVMITSRTAQKHRDLAAELGADHYLGKPYGEDELLALVARYAHVPSGAAPLSGAADTVSPAAPGSLDGP